MMTLLPSLERLTVLTLLCELPDDPFRKERFSAESCRKSKSGGNLKKNETVGFILKIFDVVLDPCAVRATYQSSTGLCCRATF
jgi:hypothetical protein